MRNKICIQIVVGISLLILTSVAGAQDEQWLQYHSERQAWRIVGDMEVSNPKVVSDEPDGIELPDFTCDEPFFALWSTPMVGAGGLWMAFDRQNKQGQPYDLLYIDQNVNGTFNDKSLEVHKCDRIRIGKKGNRDTRYVGNYIEIDDVLYRPEIARDGAYIKLGKAEDVKFGNIRLSETITEFSAGGENGLFTLKPEKGTGSLPVGRYRINYWAIERKDERGNKWKMRSSLFSQKGDFDITADKETELSIGEPIISTLEATKSGSGYSFSQNLQGRLGVRIELTRNGAQPPAPKLHIKNKDGSYDRSFSFEYG